MKIWRCPKHRTIREEVIRSCNELVHAWHSQNSKFQYLLNETHGKIMKKVYAVVNELFFFFFFAFACAGNETQEGYKRQSKKEMKLRYQYYYYSSNGSTVVT